MDREEPADLLHPLTSLEWRVCSRPPAGVYGAPMVCLGDKVYVMPSPVARLYVYSPATDKWDTKVTPVNDFALTVYRSQLVLVGGREYGGEDVVRSPSNKVWTLGEDGQWQTTLPPMEAACTDASAVSHGDHLFVIDTYQGVHVCNGHNWTRAQRPAFSSSTISHLSSTVMDGCWYVMRGTEVRYASLDSLLASCQPRDTPQSSSVWKRLPDAPVGSLCLIKFGNRLIVLGGIASYMCVFSPTTQSWVQVWSVPFPFPSFPCAVVLPSNQQFVMAGSNAYIFTIKVTPYNPLSHFTMRALSLVEAAGIPLMSTLQNYTAGIKSILKLPYGWPSSAMSMLGTWLDRHASTPFPPTWSNLLQIIRRLDLHDLAERVETCLKANTVDDQVKEGMGQKGSGEKMSSQDEVIYRLKQKVEELRSENEMLRQSLQEVIKKEVEEKPLALVPVKTELKEEAATVTKAETTSDITAATPTWVLPGVEVCGEMTVVVHSSRSQQITWEGFGLRLHIDEDSLPAGMEQCTLKIMASLAGQYELPEKSCLVSAVFWLRCEPMCKFTKPVTVEIQHCAKSENVVNLKMKFVRAVCSQKQLPYTFKELGGGEFNRHSSYGVIQVNGFSGLAVTQEGSEDREYCSQLFYLGQPNSCQIHFVVTWNIEAHLTVVKEEYRRSGASRSLCRLVDFESDTITLDIPVEGITIKGWEISPLMPPVVTKKQVDNFKEGKVTPCCQLLAEMAKKRKKIPSIKHRIALKGSRQHNDFFLINLPYGDMLCTSERVQTFGDLPSVAVVSDSLPPGRVQTFGDLAAADLGPPPGKKSRLENDQSATDTSHTPPSDPANGQVQNKPQLNELLRELCNKVSHLWQNIGILLKIDAGKLDDIKTSENNMSQNCLREMLTVWTKQVNPPPSWSAIAEAIECLGDEELAHHLRNKYVS